ncbi:MAG: UDP-glucose/GDP-mannose dehydrogenase family protein [Spirochaeta sp.]|jgi:UDPglucose 6-dehydrogenase|nr:UDP-glucose/GDP-mannose dehydrogenase family protein [Spirochaeta sp.]
MAKNIAVIGTGYVGLVSSVGLADFGNIVTGVDLRADIVDTLNSGRPTIYEIGLDSYLQRNIEAERLHFTTNGDDTIAAADIVFVAVGTPPKEDGHADLSQIEGVARQIAANLTGYKVIVTKSTVPVGTNRRIQQIIATESGQTPGRGFSVVSNPEFLREGKAVQDFFHPDRIVLGYEDERAREYMEDVYRALYLIQTPFVWCNLETAELIKYASNAFLATKITFINQMANLAEATGADIHTIAKSMGMDGRISPKFLHPGPGYGGSCFPKDTKAVAATGDEYGVDMSLIKEVIRGNDRQKTITAGKLVKLMGGSPAGKTVAVLGLAFKAETDDVRESPAIEIVQELLREGATVRAFDPEGIENFRSAVIGEGPFGGGLNSDLREKIAEAAAERLHYCTDEFNALDGADALIIVTEWNVFRNLDLDRAALLMTGRVIFDARNVLDPEHAREKGFTYAGVGRV